MYPKTTKQDLFMISDKITRKFSKDEPEERIMNDLPLESSKIFTHQIEGISTHKNVCRIKRPK